MSHAIQEINRTHVIIDTKIKFYEIIIITIESLHNKATTKTINCHIWAFKTRIFPCELKCSALILKLNAVN